MKKWLISIVLLGMLGYAVVSFYTKEKEAYPYQIDEIVNEDEQVGLEIGEVAPDFELQTLNGEFVKLSDYRGKTVMLNFWATWCPPCRAEMPDMEKFYQDTDIEILAINLVDSESSMDQITSFVEEYQLTFPILLDNGNKASEMYRIRPIPTSLFIDTNGIIQYQVYGPLNYELMVREYERTRQ
ncbi:redoxin domain-containing protein [Gracilibacillus marinus]|jgi:peroxiredoxin|uniref:Redoxin domain-containing protein n=1 Tax=Gracilibacillus marinus TaxID=630535 RepID=A0ABV8VR41_9BACI